MGGMKVNSENDTLRQMAAKSVLQIRFSQSSVRRERWFFMGRWQTVQSEQEMFSLWSIYEIKIIHIELR